METVVLKSDPAESSYLTGRSLTHHRLIRRRQVGRVQSPGAVDGNPIDGTEWRMGEVQMQASVRDTISEFQ